LSDKISDYNFELPDELIAQSPSQKREEARLLVVRRNPTAGMPQFEDLQIKDLPMLAEQDPHLKNSVWLRNRSRVFKARFYAQRASGSRHEVVLLEEKSPGLWSALIRNQAKMEFPERLKTLGAVSCDI
jgi:S-adenosylmethionine:tRNA ribosyltransferase-isomerase